MTAKLKSLNSPLNKNNKNSTCKPQYLKSIYKRPKTVACLVSNNSSTFNSDINLRNDVPDISITDKNEVDYHIPGVDKTQNSCFISDLENTCVCGETDISSRISSLKRVSYLERRNWINTERLAELRKRAQEAIKHHKIFTIRGCFYSIRKSLLLRGWVEKLDIHRRAPMNGSCQVILEDVALQYLPQRRPGETRRQHIQKCERNIMSRFLEHMPIDFLWSARKEKSDWIDMARNPNLTINRFAKSPFTTKEGLCNILENVHWFFEEGKSETYFPRSYSVCSADDLEELIRDYRLTACMSILRFLIIKKSSDQWESIFAEDGQIPLSCVRFALNQCKSFIRSCQHLDIDEETAIVWNHDWEVFLVQFQMLTQENLKIQKPTESHQLESLIEECSHSLQLIGEYWPQSNLDGIFNIWIVKPSNRCRGRGIHILNDIKKIIGIINPPVLKARYVVQKYIERPMTIHNCKFDIRQWFLVTSIQPLIIWMYKESYLRFSSQEYNLSNLHESVHLTNHAVQKRYENGNRDERLPRENMWDNLSFQTYLRQIGKSDVWLERIYPGMQQALIGTMLASQDLMDRRSNTFELFGADFMITEDYQPWLIEINASPDLGSTTNVTARLCPQCLEDIIKVVVDYRNDPNASTGNFEMIYRQVIPPAPAYLGLNLCIKGNQIVAKNFGKKLDTIQTKKQRRSIKVAVQAVPVIKNENTDSELLHGAVEPIISSDPINFTKKSAQLSSLQLKPVINKKIQMNQKTTQLTNGFSTSRILREIDLHTIKNSSRFISSRRHSSCGPKLTLTNFASNDVKNNESDKSSILGEINKLKCIGNKCSARNENAKTLLSEKLSSGALGVVKNGMHPTNKLKVLMVKEKLIVDCRKSLTKNTTKVNQNLSLKSSNFFTVDLR